MSTNCLVCNKPLSKKQIQKKQKTCSRECYRKSVPKGYDDTFMNEPTEFSDYFLGVWTAIGHMNKKEARIIIETTHLELINVLKEGSKYTNKIEESNREGHTKTYIISYAGALSKRLKELGYTPGKKKGKERIPEDIYNNTIRFADFLRGFLDAKNSFYKHESYPELLQLRFSSMNKDFLLGIDSKLKEIKATLGGSLISIPENNTFRLSFFHDDAVGVGTFIYREGIIRTSHNYKLYLKHKDNQIGRIYEHGYSIDFLDVLNDFSCYFIGLFTADGHISKDNFHTTLPSVDYQIIKDIAERTNYTNEIMERKDCPGRKGKKTQFILDFGLPITNKLTSLGYNVGIKTGREHIPDIILNNIDYFRSFLRGFSDGDGSFYIIKKEGTLGYTIPCANKLMLENIRNKLKELNVVYGGSLNPIKTDGLPMWSLSFKHRDAISLGDFLYKNETICLHRKKEKYMQGKKRGIFRQRNEGKTCSIMGCNATAHCKGLCKKHYAKKHAQKPSRKEYMRKYMKEYKRKKKLQAQKINSSNPN